MAMSNRIVRLFTIGGVQRSPFNLSGPVVCLSAYKHLLMAVYHAGLGKFVLSTIAGRFVGDAV